MPITSYGNESEEAPVACTLDVASLGGRIDEWRQVLAHANARQPLDDGVRVEFSPDVPVAELARLVVAEHDCCPFFRFSISVDRRPLALEVRAPADAQSIVHALFGAPL